MAELYGELHGGDVAIFDRGYTNFREMSRLEAKGVFFVVREKRGMRYGVEKRRRKLPGNILSDEWIVLLEKDSNKKYPGELCLHPGKSGSGGEKLQDGVPDAQLRVGCWDGH
jgi:hypothetical protein